MRYFKVLLAAVALLVFSQSMLAQHAGHGGVMGGSGTMGHDSMADMQKMMAMQATKEQAEHVRQLVTATETALSHAQALQQSSAESAGSVQAREELQKAVAEATEHQRMLLGSLTSDQQSGLGSQVQKINRREAEVNKQLQALDREINPADRKRTTQQVHKLHKALADWEDVQRGIASAMGM